jgi:hypothetical protein
MTPQRLNRLGLRYLAALLLLGALAAACGGEDTPA